MAVKPLISSFKQRGKIETMYLGEAAREMAPPLLLGAALLILTLTGVSVLFRHFSEEKPPKSHTRVFKSGESPDLVLVSSHPGIFSNLKRVQASCSFKSAVVASPTTAASEELQHSSTVTPGVS